MSEWIDIHEYRDFYDVPRIFVIDVDGRIILFDCQFVDELDEYSDEYKIYELSDTSLDTLSDDWTELSCLAGVCKGQVAVSKVTFDDTKRKRIKRSVLADFGV